MKKRWRAPRSSLHANPLSMITGAIIAVLFLAAGIIAFMYMQKGAM
jgi:hypothetical protein